MNAISRASACFATILSQISTGQITVRAITKKQLASKGTVNGAIICKDFSELIFHKLKVLFPAAITNQILEVVSGAEALRG